MAVLVYIWPASCGPRWLAVCPDLQTGISGDTRDYVERELRREAKLRSFGDDVELIDGPPPQEMQ